MRGAVTSVDDYLHVLGDRLRGPARLRTDLLTEVRDSLVDATEAYARDGLDGPAAQRRALAEFGDPAELAPAYQAELAAGALRGLAVRVVAVAAALIAGGDLTWRGASWTDTAPPTGYEVLSAALEWLWIGSALLALAGYVWVRRSARDARPAPPLLTRVFGLGLAGVPAAGALAGAGLYVWSVALWDDALTWPPMIIGAVVTSAAFLWLARAARSCLVALR